MNNRFLYSLALLVIIFPNPGYSRQEGSDLTALEWAAWPDFCKAAFAASAWSGHTPFTQNLNKTWVKNIRATHNQRIGIAGPHHFCLGMVYVNRARAASTRNVEKRIYQNALDELNYTYQRIRDDAPAYSLFAAYMGRAYYGIGEKKRALSIWNKGIQLKPASHESYLMLAEVLFAEDKYEEALNYLLQLEQNLKKPRHDVEYFLGHAYLKLGRYDAAKQHSKKADELGNRFPGLRRKLQELGK